MRLCLGSRVPDERLKVMSKDLRVRSRDSRQQIGVSKLCRCVADTQVLAYKQCMCWYVLN